MAVTTPAPQSSGMTPNTAATLAYLLGILSGIFFYLTEKNDKYVRFHAIQSIALGVVMFIPSMFIPFFGALAYIALTVYLMVKAYHGEKYKLPVLGDFAEKKV